ncbi:hypothetical protein TKK_0013473 [Trichogramma kaykai]|uniref:HAP1 N-terminal domain-containing protein n=1 Tax=Trichogramma kaykai TaxID=54128 RepID=A0ABD2WJH4_9HYME
MFLGAGSSRLTRPRGPAKFKDVREKRDAILSKWRDEVCSRDELPEVEIISLLTEQIPKYTLRADTLTEFGGYENQDWFIPSAKVVEHDESLGLTPEQIRETLNYFSEYKRPFIFIINL